MQDATYNSQCNMQHATCNMQQHEACDIQHATWKHLVPLVEEAVPDAQHRLHVRHHLRPCMRIFRRTARSDGGDAPSPCVTNERCRMCCVLYGVRCMPRGSGQGTASKCPTNVTTAAQCTTVLRRCSAVAQSTTQRTHIVFEVAAEEADEPFDCVQVRGAAPVHQHRIHAGVSK
jgi:hypothetical protein